MGSRRAGAGATGSRGRLTRFIAPRACRGWATERSKSRSGGGPADRDWKMEAAGKHCWQDSIQYAMLIAIHAPITWTLEPRPNPAEMERPEVFRWRNLPCGTKMRHPLRPNPASPASQPARYFRSTLNFSGSKSGRVKEETSGRRDRIVIKPSGSEELRPGPQ